MKNLALAVAVVLVGCDAPRDKRFVPKKDTTFYSSPSPFGGFNTGSVENTQTGTGSGSGSGSGGSSTPVAPTETVGVGNIPADVGHCSWSTDGSTNYQFNHSHLGDYSFCRSTQSETTVYIQVKQSFASPPLCIIPTTNFGGSSTYIGEPRCVYPISNTTIYKIILYKNRYNYTNFPLTGVMIMKDQIHQYGGPYENQYLLVPDAYMHCIDMLSQSTEYCAEFQKYSNFIYQPIN